MTLKELRNKDMTKQEKWDHIWEYYKLHIIGAIVGLVIIYSFLNIWVFNPPAKNALDITVRAEWYISDEGAALAEELTALLIDPEANEMVMVEHLPVGESIDPQMVMASEAKFIGKIEVGEMDFLLMSEPVYLGMLQEDIMADFDMIEDTYGIEIPEALKVVGSMPETGEGVYTLDVSGIPKLHKLVGESADPFYLGIFVNTDRMALAVEALEYLLEE